MTDNPSRSSSARTAHLKRRRVWALPPAISTRLPRDLGRVSQCCWLQLCRRASPWPEERTAHRFDVGRERRSPMCPHSLFGGVVGRQARKQSGGRVLCRSTFQVHENSGGTKGTTLRDTGLPVIIVTHTGNKTGAIRKTPLMRVKDGDGYVLLGSQGGLPEDPVWVHNLRADANIELRDETVVRPMRVR